jgi:signal transduction histidine kinase
VKGFSLRSVTVQLIILFVAVLTLFEIVYLGYRYIDRTKALTSLEAIRIADNIAVLASIIEKTPPPERAAVTGHFKGSGLHVFSSEDRGPHSEPAQNPEAGLLRELLLRVLPHAADTDVVVGYAASQGDAAGQENELAMTWQRAGPFPEPVGDIIEELSGGPTFYVSVRLSDGTWLNFVAAYVETIDFWPLRSVTLLSILVSGIVALSIWAIQRLIAPFRVFAAAAARLGTDVNATPIEEHGPSEVRGAIRAFNDMQRRLQRFIEDRTQMLAAVSHDLRTPITRLRLRAECVKNPTQSAKFFADLREMEDMIDGVLTFAKEDALSERTISVDLMAMLQSICDELTDRGFEVSFAASGRCPYWCRRVSTRRCFANLIENAVKYGQKAEVSLEVGANEIMIRIEDRGPGIPEEFREQVFRPFFRLETSRNRLSGGSGLGLTVARTVARAHGGDVRLSARPGGGLTATVILPQSEIPPSSLQPLAAAAE